MEKYKLAIIIPCWKCSKFVGLMLESILAQTFQDWQVFCVDDQSPDDTQNVLKEYSEKDKRIHYCVRDRAPKGAQTCRNIGFELTEGAEYVIWFDADDLIAPYCFEQRVQFMDRHPELDFGIFPAKTFKVHIKDEGWNYYYGIPISDNALVDMLNGTLPMVGWTNIYNRHAINNCNVKWDENILSMQDTDWNIQNILKGMKYDFAIKEGAKIDYFYRVDNDNSTISKRIFSESHFLSHIYLLNKLDNSLSVPQKKQYNKNLKIYFLKFALIFKSNKFYFAKYVNIPWIVRHPFYRSRLLLWNFLGCHFLYSLFFIDVKMMKKKIQSKVRGIMFEMRENKSVIG